MTLPRTAARAALLPLAAALLTATLLGGCASHAEIPVHPAVPAALDRAEGVPGWTAAATPPRAASAEQLPTSTTTSTVPNAPVDTDRQRPTDGVLLRIKKDVTVHGEPGGPAFARLPADQRKDSTWVPMIERRGDWARVLLPSRPNGSAGWINAGDARAVSAAATPYRVDVDVDARRLVVRENGEEVGSWTVGVGAERTPTPRGRTFITAAVQEAVPRVSPIVLPLGAHSETLNDYGGGPGTVALHGWPDPRVFGTASSDGCVRLPDDALRVLQRLPLGTLVLVH